MFTDQEIHNRQQNYFSMFMKDEKSLVSVALENGWIDTCKGTGFTKTMTKGEVNIYVNHMGYVQTMKLDEKDNIWKIDKTIKGQEAINYLKQ